MMLVQCFLKLLYFRPQWDSVIFPPKHSARCSLASPEVLIFIPPSIFPSSNSLYRPLAFSFVFWVPHSLSLSLFLVLSLPAVRFWGQSWLLCFGCWISVLFLTVIESQLIVLGPRTIFRVDQERVTNQRMLWGYWGLSWAQREWDSVTNKPLTILLKKVGGI